MAKIFLTENQCHTNYFAKKVKKVLAGNVKGCIFAARKRGKEGRKRGEELAETIFESLRPAQDRRPVTREGEPVVG